MTDRGKVLVLDDNKLVLKLTQEMLEAEGFTVQTLDSPFYLASSVRDFGPDLILIDINMPQMSGEKIMLICRSGSWFEGVPKVFYSDQAEEKLRTIAEKCEADGYLLKTGDRNQFIADVSAWVEKRKATQCG